MPQEGCSPKIHPALQRMPSHEPALSTTNCWSAHFTCVFRPSRTSISFKGRPGASSTDPTSHPLAAFHPALPSWLEQPAGPLWHHCCSPGSQLMSQVSVRTQTVCSVWRDQGDILWSQPLCPNSVNVTVSAMGKACVYQRGRFWVWGELHSPLNRGQKRWLDFQVFMCVVQKWCCCTPSCRIAYCQAENQLLETLSHIQSYFLNIPETQ